MGIKNVQGQDKQIEKPLLSNAIFKFEQFLESHRDKP